MEELIELSVAEVSGSCSTKAVEASWMAAVEGKRLGRILKLGKFREKGNLRVRDVREI